MSFSLKTMPNLIVRFGIFHNRADHLNLSVVLLTQKTLTKTTAIRS
ncbi:hypothetical protein FH603_4374 [Spirosoma sp. LMG 31447]|uniref:Uncharacterized protein n=1 Tax=Spirosoma utsteinense TaxID=2585773 RepID=A0ABR6WBD1_9BACT|nr:hypothetical protein [Spirosoma utsteinense]